MYSVKYRIHRNKELIDTDSIQVYIRLEDIEEASFEGWLLYNFRRCIYLESALLARVIGLETIYIVL